MAGSDLVPNKKCIPRLLTPIMGGKNLPVCPSLAPVTLAPVRQGLDSSEVEGGVWNPGDSLSPPDISPVRPLIRQAGRAGPTSPVGCSVWAGACRATQAPAAQHWPIRVRARAARLSAPPDRPSAAAPAEPRAELGFVYSRREYILQLS